MNFERGKDPKEVMEVGRKKDAITITSIKCYSNGQLITLRDPDIIEIFLNQISEISFPYNPVFGPQRIVMESMEKYTDVSYSRLVRSLNQSIGQLAPSDVDLVEKERPIDISIFQYEGKTVIFQGKMYQMPTLNELEEKGFGFFEKCESNYRKDIENEEKLAMESSKRSIAALQAQMKEMSDILRPTKANLELHIYDRMKKLVEENYEKEKEYKNKKGFWNPFKNTDPIRLLPFYKI